MNIRKAIDSDINEIISLYHELMDYEMSLLKSDMLEIQLNWESKKTFEEIEKVLKDSTKIIFLAENKNRIVGFILGGISKGIKYKEGALDIYILEEHRGKGIGTQLMNKIFEWFRKEDCMSVMINAYADNKRAVDFYKKYGLVLLGETYKVKL